MRAYTLEHANDHDLNQILAERIARQRTGTVDALVAIGEYDARRLYLPAGYPSMFAYCVGVLHLSEDAAYKRIQAARAARRFPAIFPALDEGRLHLTAVNLLAPHLTPDNADELIAAATWQPKSAIEELLARRFPRTEWLPMVHAVTDSGPMSNPRLAPAQVGSGTAGRGSEGRGEPAPGQVGAPRAKMAPLAATRFALQVTIGQGTRDKLQHARALLSHSVPAGDIATVLDRALDALIERLEKRKCGATQRPRSGRRRPSTNARTIPAHVRRAVWVRDGGQCTFVGEGGHRCLARTLIEFDHIDPATARERGKDVTACLPAAKRNRPRPIANVT